MIVWSCADGAPKWTLSHSYFVFLGLPSQTMTSLVMILLSRWGQRISPTFMKLEMCIFNEKKLVLFTFFVRGGCFNCSSQLSVPKWKMSYSQLLLLLRILLKQNTAIPLSVCPCVTGVTSHISHIYKGMLIIKPYIFWIKIILAIFLAKTRPDHLLRPDQPDHWFWL